MTDLTVAEVEALLDGLKNKDAETYGINNVWFADHTDENGELNEASYLYEVYAKAVEFIESQE